MKKKDFILIGVILSVAFILFGAIELSKKEGAYVSVRVNGTEVARYSLSENGEYSLNGGTNILKIENGEAYMKEANCPTLGSTRCTNQGKISRTLETITCQYYNVAVIVYGAEKGEGDLVG